MLTTSAVPESWFRSGAGIDKSTGRPFVLVHRNKDGVPHTWRIEKTTNSNGRVDWRHVESIFSDGRTESFRGRIGAGRNLSDSKIDVILRSMLKTTASCLSGSRPAERP